MIIRVLSKSVSRVMLLAFYVYATVQCFKRYNLSLSFSSSVNCTRGELGDRAVGSKLANPPVVDNHRVV